MEIVGSRPCQGNVKLFSFAVRGLDMAPSPFSIWSLDFFH